MAGSYPTGPSITRWRGPGTVVCQDSGWRYTSDPMTNRDLWQEQVAMARACRIMAQRGLVEDVLGHVSLRVAADRVLLRCRGPREQGLRFTVPEDIRLVALD